MMDKPYFFIDTPENIDDQKVSKFLEDSGNLTDIFGEPDAVEINWTAKTYKRLENAGNAQVHPNVG